MAKLPNTVSRRGILGGSVTVGLLGITNLSAQVANTPKTSPTNLKVSITLDGATYSYPNGSSVPSYYVGFRDDGRIVFHLGALGIMTGSASTGKPHHLGLHHVRIESDGRVLLDTDVPAHWWNSKWTYRPAPIVVKKSPAQIIAGNRMFPFGDTGCKVGAPPARVPFQKPMDTSGITKYMPTTGERRDIGLVTDPSAWFMLGGTPADMIDWALAAGSCPLHFRDESTGKPVDLTKYPTANAYDVPAVRPWLPKGPTNANGYTVFGGDWCPQQAHFCEMSYLAHIATGDLGFLEDLQYEANFVVLTDAARSTPAGAILWGEMRGLAWGMRQLFMAHVATQDAEAAGVDLEANGLHPSSYFKTLIGNQLKFYSPNMVDPTNQTFRLFSNGVRFGNFQCDYIIESLAFGVLTGHSEWAAFYLFCLGNAIARTNGTSGYPVGVGSTYYLNTVPHLPVPPGQDPATWRQDNNLDPNGAKLTWAQAYAGYVQEQYDINARMLNGVSDPVEIAKVTSQIQKANAQIDAWVAKLKADPFNGGVGMFGNESLMATRAVLVMAAYLESKGLANVRARYPELDTCIANIQKMVLAGGGMNPRVSVVTRPETAR